MAIPRNFHLITSGDLPHCPPFPLPSCKREGRGSYRGSWSFEKPFYLPKKGKGAEGEKFISQLQELRPMGGRRGSSLNGRRGEEKSPGEIFFPPFFSPPPSPTTSLPNLLISPFSSLFSLRGGEKSITPLLPPSTPPRPFNPLSSSRPPFSFSPTPTPLVVVYCRAVKGDSTYSMGGEGEGGGVLSVPQRAEDIFFILLQSP